MMKNLKTLRALVLLTLLGILGCFGLIAKHAYGAEPEAGEPFSPAQDKTRNALKSLPVYFEDRESGDVKHAQLSLIAFSVEEAARATKPKGLKLKDWTALLLMVGYMESTFSLRIHAGQCKPHECDGGRARGPWQQHRNGRSESDWEKLTGFEHTQFQALTAGQALRRSYLTCKGSRAPWLQGTLNNYAGQKCEALEWGGLEERLRLWSKVRAKL